MKSKIYTIVSLGVIGVVVIATSLLIILNGAKNGGFNYVRLEYNPSIEFVTDTKDNIVSYKPLNDSARLVIAGLDLDNKDISEAIDEIMNESLKMGQFKLGVDDYNVIKLTSVSGLTQALDVHVYKAVNKFLKENQVQAIIVENADDMEKIGEAKELKTTVHELALIDSITSVNNVSKESISSKMPDELIDIVMYMDDEYIKNNPISDDELREKEEIKSNFSVEYESHMNSISKDTLRAYMEKRNELSKSKQRELELKFSSAGIEGIGN